MFRTVLIVPLLMILSVPLAHGEESTSDILEGIRHRYGTASGLSVPYTREVVTRSMSMLGTQAAGDLASGIIYFKAPHFLRLDQEKPQTEKIVANGDILWWYIPQKKEAHRYKAEDFGRELRLLSDIFRGLADVSDSFKVRLAEKNKEGDNELVLVPDPPWQEIDRIALTVGPGHNIRSVHIFNALGSVTKFNLGDFDLGRTFEEEFFQFAAPPGVTVISGSQ